jgi:hypothetical protein
MSIQQAAYLWSSQEYNSQLDSEVVNIEKSWWWVVASLTALKSIFVRAKREIPI